MLTYKQMYTQVGQFVQDTSSGRELRIKDALNRRYTKLAMEDWHELHRIEDTGIAYQSGDSGFLYLPKRVAVVKKIVQETTPTLLQNVDLGTFIEERFFHLTQQGNSLQYSPAGRSAVKRTISTAETFDVVSSASGDTVGISVEILGRVGDNELRETVTVNGTSTVVTTNSWTEISSIGVDGTRDGVITLTGTTSSVEYAAIAPLEVSSEYQRLKVWPLPNASENVTIVYKKRVQPLLNDGDVPEMPCAEALVEFTISDILRQQRKGVLAREHERQGNEILRTYQGEYLQQGENIQVSSPMGSRSRRTVPTIVTTN